MHHARMSIFAGLCLLGQMPAQPAWAFDAAFMQGPIYLCQFGDTAHAYAFKQEPDGHWEGLGQLQGWSVTVQDDGLVARNADDVLILGGGSASLLQQGRLMRGHCVDPRSELAQLFETEEFNHALRDDFGSDAAERLPQLPAEPPMGAAETQAELHDPFVADVLSILDPANWDAVQVAAIIDALNLDTSAKLNLKAELKAAARDPARIRGLARQIRAAFGLEIAAATELRARLKETRQELAAVTHALQQLRQNAKDTAARLAVAQAKASAAERANAQAVAQIATLRASLNAALSSEDEMRSTLGTAVALLSATREKLALANKRIAKLGGVPVRP